MNRTNEEFVHIQEVVDVHHVILETLVKLADFTLLPFAEVPKTLK
jgi:hypothetical protein